MSGPGQSSTWISCTAAVSHLQHAVGRRAVLTSEELIWNTWTEVETRQNANETERKWPGQLCSVVESQVDVLSL